MGHIKMMGATQPFISGAISKTVNVPKDATVADIQEAYIQSWKLGAKAISIYRDGSKRTQPLNTSKDKTAAEIAQAAAASMVTGPIRRKLPDERHAITHKFDIQGHEGVHHGRDVRKRPAGRDLPRHGEGRLDDLGLRRRVRAGDLLRALQYGVPLQALVDKFSHVRFEPSGMTKNRRSASRSRSSTTSSGGWRASSCRRRRSSTPASTAGSWRKSRRRRNRCRSAAARRRRSHGVLDDSESGRRRRARHAGPS
jgi:ribonucleotide reductase alpha subunit